VTTYSALNAKEEIRVLAPTGSLGSGYLQTSLEEGLRRKPHFIGCDAGSTDAGAASLGTGKYLTTRRALKRDLKGMLVGARQHGIPLLVGSCFGAGGDPHVDAAAEVVEEIAREEGLKFKMALIRAEQSKEYLKAKLRAGKIRPLDNAPAFDEEVIDRSERIVGMMGAEPFVAALEGGADVILAGRSSDTAIFASIPTKLGFPAGLSWHAAKILECGAAAATHRKSPDSMIATIRHDGFVVEPLDPELRCTPQSIAAHSLYENADPFLLKEPSGTIDLRNAVYEKVDDRSVRVSGSDFQPASQYTIKLEGAELIGYQSVVIGSIRDPFIIRQIDPWLERLREKIAARARDIFGDDCTYDLTIHIYGKDGTMGPLEPVTTPAHELCLLFKVTASEQEIASTVASMTRHQALHLPIPEWSGLISGVAFPITPAYFDRGPVYRFNMNQVVEVDDPLEMFRIEYRDVA
jgi:hypothetical protein